MLQVPLQKWIKEGYKASGYVFTNRPPPWARLAGFIQAIFSAGPNSTMSSDAQKVQYGLRFNFINIDW